MDLNDDDIELSEDEEITVETVLKTVQCAWQNERLAPEILPHRNDMVECMLGQIQHMERNINKLPKTDLRASIHKMELSRIKFVICNYLKTRLHKIEKFCITIVNEERQRIESGTNYLTPAEFKYAQEYLLNMETHLKKVVLNKVPGNMQSLELSKLAVYPNLHSHVFLKANDTVTGVVLEDQPGDQDEEIDLEDGSQHILQYKPIAELVKNGKVQLV
ncbi:DNA replication complex GINS protein SLD5 [Leguminivora glycinivorella]|uniref:DNA replication complex GINS protein SLD5 n=1 Tax=Leguminivora glycinivorella TaxID=1035111 RepID=UPI00200C80E6|nr:DNA replication complex GINS protein SLD5 [Leguminivora glycinivorella]